MAETAGVKTQVKTRKQAQTGKKKKNKGLLIGGAALGGILLLSHKGSGSGTAQSSDQLATGELDAYQQGIQDAGNIAGLDSGSSGVSGGAGSGDGTTGTGSGTTGDGTGTGAGSGDTPPQVIDINVSRSGRKGKGKGKRKHPNSRPKGHNRSHKKHHGAGEKSAVQHHNTKTGPRPAEPHRTKPAPANQSGHHPTTHRRHHRGYRRGSAVEVESPEGEGYGITVFGRTFPGATGFRNGPPRSIPGAGIVRDVTVIYGGHCETHTYGMNDGAWFDMTRGRNPLKSRPVPHLIRTSELG